MRRRGRARRPDARGTHRPERDLTEFQHAESGRLARAGIRFRPSSSRSGPGPSPVSGLISPPRGDRGSSGTGTGPINRPTGTRTTSSRGARSGQDSGNQGGSRGQDSGNQGGSRGQDSGNQGGSRGQDSGNQGGGTTNSGGNDSTGQRRTTGGSGSTNGVAGQSSAACAAPCHVIEQPVLIAPLAGSTSPSPQLPGTAQTSATTPVTTPHTPRPPILSSRATSRLLAGAGPATNRSAATRTARAARAASSPVVPAARRPSGERADRRERPSGRRVKRFDRGHHSGSHPSPELDEFAAERDPTLRACRAGSGLAGAGRRIAARGDGRRGSGVVRRAGSSPGRPVCRDEHRRAHRSAHRHPEPPRLHRGRGARAGASAPLRTATGARLRRRQGTQGRQRHRGSLSPATACCAPPRGCCRTARGPATSIGRLGGDEMGRAPRRADP